jgi:HK97 gp10 family phage protein
VIGFDASDLERAVADTANQITEALDESTQRELGFTGAAIFREGAKHNARKHAKTYTIFNSIIVKRLEEESDGGNRQAYLVTVRKGRYGGGDAFYWRFVEEGHKFVPKNKNVSAKTGKTIGWAAHRRATELEYGNARVPAYPFMRPAYSNKRDEALNSMTAKLKEQLERNATR